MAKIPSSCLKVPETVIRMHVDAEPHEIVYQDGGHSTLNELFPFMRGCWRIKVRCRYKSEEKKWQNAKGEGSLVHLELTDREGSRMQATLFKEMIKEHGKLFKVGGVYEICQGVVQPSQTKFNKQQNENCYLFDKHSKVRELKDDFELPGSDDQSQAKGISWCTLEKVADANPTETVNYMGIIHKIGEVGSVTTKSGKQKLRRNIVVVDHTNVSCVVCFWADKHIEMLDDKVGSVIGI